MSHIALSTDLSTVECGECGGVYAIAANYKRIRQERGGYWTCPYCKCSWGYGETEIGRLRDQLARERSNAEAAQRNAQIQRDRACSAERRASAYKGVVTRTKNRVAPLLR